MILVTDTQAQITEQVYQARYQFVSRHQPIRKPFAWATLAGQIAVIADYA